MNKRIAAIRREYTLQELTLESVDKNPFAQFKKWFGEALAAEVTDPTAMTLATADLKGHPSARIVLLKDFSGEGLSFYTNYESKKGQQLSRNPNAALVFFWPELERQVRLEGRVNTLPSGEADSYFNTRPAESKIGAWASRQSRELSSRESLKNSVDEFTSRFKDQTIPRPHFWGGYRVVPHMIEYWQGRPGRLHDRIQYKLQNNKWNISRLSP